VQAGPCIRALAWPGAAALAVPLARSAHSARTRARARASQHDGLGGGRVGVEGGVENVGQGGGRFEGEGAERGVSAYSRRGRGGWGRAAAQVAQDYAGESGDA